MQNRDYWKKRFLQLEEASNKQGIALIQDIEKQYYKAQQEIEAKISVWFQRFADNNNISLLEARKRLNTKELEELKWDIQEYIKYGKENAISEIWVKQLENASTKFHITRLEALKLQLQQEVEKLYGNELDMLDKGMKAIYLDSYYHTAYEIQKGFKIAWDVAAVNDKQLANIITKPWAVDGKNFSERIWGNKTKLINEIHTELTQSIMLGRSPDKAIRNIVKKMNVSRSQAGTLVMTEQAYFSNLAQKNCYVELGVSKYEIVATLDSHTSELCRSLDGKVFDMKDYVVGATAPPFHVRCRTATVPYFEDNFGKRAARGIDGKTYYVDANMKFKEWYGKHIKDNPDTELAEKKIKNLTADKKQYEIYKKILGKDIPSSIDEFQNLKYTDSEEWKLTKYNYKLKNSIQTGKVSPLKDSNRLHVAKEKYTNYIFNPDNPNGYAKGKAITSRLGYDSNNYEEFDKLIKSNIGKFPAIHKGSNTFGEKYEVNMVLRGLTGKQAKVKVGILLENGTNKPKLTTVYIDKLKESDL